MNKRYLVGLLLTLCVCSTVWAASDLAPALPDLNLPAESEQPIPAAEPAQPAAAAAPQKKKTSVKKNTAKKAAAAKTAVKKTASASKQNFPPVTNTVTKVNTEEIAVENLIPQQQIQPVAAAVPPAEVASVAAAPAAPAQGAPAANAAAPAVPQAQALAAQTAAGGVKALAPQKLVQYNPPTDRDPTLSPDDTLLLKHREEERLRALEAERQRKLAEERRRLAELERQRQLELERLRDPSREVRGKIRVSGIIGQEVFIGNRIYTVGKSVYGARIVKVLPESVVFTYKGQQFTKKVDLQ